MPKECFPRAEGRLKDDNDAQIMAQVIAVGGTLLLSSNLVMVKDKLLQDWFDRHHNEWPGVQAGTIVQRVDKLFCRWWKDRMGPTVLTRSAIAAFWPERTSASHELVLAHTRDGLEAMSRGHFEEFAPQVLAHIAKAHDIRRQIDDVRARLPQRMRQAEAERMVMMGDEPGTEHEGANQTATKQHRDERYHW